MQALAMTVAEIPVFVYTTFGQSVFSQLRLSPGLRKVLFATALGTVALALAAHQLKRRRRRKKQIAPEKCGFKPGGITVPILPTRRVSSVKKGYSSRRVQSPGSKSNDTLSGISSIEPSKHSSSSHSLASMVAVNSSSPTPAGLWEAQAMGDAGAIGDSSAESLYVQGMELFEEALQKWEQALSIRQRDSASTSTPVPWDSRKQQESMSENISELFDSLPFEEMPFHLSRPAAAYEEALQLVKEGKVACRTLRTELLGCYSDQDFLAKLHCVRQAFQELLEDESNQLFFGEVGKQMVIGLMTKAEKNPKAFLESYEEMLRYALKQETWPTTQQELEGRGVVCMSFFDIVLDFILMDAFEDLENPPSSVLAVLRNRWLSDSFKETALATACWSVLKAKRRLLMVPDGFISHFYSVSEHVSPVLAFGFLGPKQQLSEVCSFFKHQIVQYLKDMFDFDNVRYTTVQLLAEDILQLSRRRSEILLGYLGTESAPEMNGTLPGETEPLKEELI
ncbi:mitoguardin 2 [Willisornis vidua]|uniref:Mitoguardin 2 n=1 Tax=Willisornis vidua TaxID=1566151 RepID=A0ABQ9D8W0_9PASS|nr:mitoguardin 2 [Willisornis vidua]